jgi:hypothetical protein
VKAIRYIQQRREKVREFDELVREFESSKPLPPPESLGPLPSGRT